MDGFQLVIDIEFPVQSHVVHIRTPGLVVHIRTPGLVVQPWAEYQLLLHLVQECTLHTHNDDFFSQFIYLTQ